MVCPLSDLHCHILPGIDDGATDLEMSTALLHAEAAQGVEQIMFTPHFHAGQMELEDFLQARRSSSEQIVSLCERLGLSGALGAEVRLEPQLLGTDLDALTFAGTGYLLLEWPFSTYPLWGEEMIDHILGRGIRPLFAHIERYEYLFYDPERLSGYIARGTLCQMNASAVLRSGTQKQALRLIKEGYVHVLSSDTHDPDRRPPRLKEAFRVVGNRLGRDAAARLQKNADDVFGGRDVTAIPPKQKKRRFWNF